MVLAHELVHAGHGGGLSYQFDASEPQVMRIANQIAVEVNANAPSEYPDYDTSRDNHESIARYYNANSILPDAFTIGRPGCP
jgi:hypothetical protein